MVTCFVSKQRFKCVCIKPTISEAQKTLSSSICRAKRNNLEEFALNVQVSIQFNYNEHPPVGSFGLYYRPWVSHNQFPLISCTEYLMFWMVSMASISQNVL